MPPLPQEHKEAASLTIQRILSSLAPSHPWPSTGSPSMAALQGPLLGGVDVSPDMSSPLGIAVALLALAGVLLLLLGPGAEPAADRGRSSRVSGARESRHDVESGAAAVAADDGRCSEVGAAALRAGGHAVDAAVAAALCLGMVHSMSSGLGGGAFIVVADGPSTPCFLLVAPPEQRELWDVAAEAAAECRRDAEVVRGWQPSSATVTSSGSSRHRRREAIRWMRHGREHGWEHSPPQCKISAGSSPGGKKNASWGAVRLEMLLPC
ncbi:hypothetical protein VPH35_098788 [Triticum aestivum]